MPARILCATLLAPLISITPLHAAPPQPPPQPGDSFKCTDINNTELSAKLCYSDTRYRQHWLLHHEGEWHALEINLGQEWVTNLYPSANGRWLAIESASEGHFALSLIATEVFKQTEALPSIDKGMGHINLDMERLYFEGWDGDTLLLREEHGEARRIRIPAPNTL